MGTDGLVEMLVPFLPSVPPLPLGPIRPTWFQLTAVCLLVHLGAFLVLTLVKTPPPRLKQAKKVVVGVDDDEVALAMTMPDATNTTAPVIAPSRFSNVPMMPPAPEAITSPVECPTYTLDELAT